MLVKCWDLDGEKRPKEQCYKAPNNKYYSCKEAYDLMVENKKYQDKCVDLYRQWIGRKDAGPSIWTKKMKECKVYGNDVIYGAMLLSDGSVRYALTHKEFNNEYQMAAYIWAIVNGNIINSDRKIKQKKRRQAEAKRIEKTYQYEDEEIPTSHRSKGIDLSRFV